MILGGDSVVREKTIEYETKDGKKVKEKEYEIVPSKSGAAAGMFIGGTIAGPVGVMIGGALGGIFGPAD